MNQTALDTYWTLMATIRYRFETLAELTTSNVHRFAKAELAAFHGRKIVEAIAFGCLVATENGLRQVPRDAKGKWNAEDIFLSLKSKSISAFPSPSEIRYPRGDAVDESEVRAVIEGIPERRLSHDDMIAIYRRFHVWLHELNPYTQPNRDSFHDAHVQSLTEDIGRLRDVIERHFISINGEGFFATLWNGADREVKVNSLSRTTEKVKGFDF